MRWVSEYPECNETRQRRIFLLLPLTLPITVADSSKFETRWLEWAWVKEIYRSGGIHYDAGWSVVAWADKQEKNNE